MDDEGTTTAPLFSRSTGSLAKRMAIAQGQGFVWGGPRTRLCRYSTTQLY